MLPSPLSDPDDRFSPAREVLAEAVRQGAFPGCAFGVLAGGEVVLEGALGRFTYEEDSPAVVPQTVFDVASLTKVAATTAAAMLLVQRGQLDLETPLAELLPGFQAAPETAPGADRRAPGTPVRIRHLLAHNSGLPGYVEFFRAAQTADALLDACLNLPLQAEPGLRAEYSDPGFILLGKAIEALTGEPLDRWASREIFAPLAMTATCFNPPPALRASFPPTEEDKSFRRRAIQGEAQDENAFVLSGVAGHAGVFSPVADLLRFAAAILTLPAAPALFDPAVVERFARRQEPTGSSRALGWDTPSENSSAGEFFSPRSIGHLGYSGCSLWIDRDAQLAVVLLSNRTWPDRGCRLIRQVRPLFHNAARRALLNP
jgi:CubicO group peptidase (beta-lactamase class C family)